MRSRVYRLTMERLEDRAVPTAGVATDKQDYALGETALITGSGFQAGETVRAQAAVDKARHTLETASG